MDSATYNSYMEILKQRLSEYRLRHSLAVADSCRELARQYGGDEEKMFLAGLLHDVMKEASREETFALAEKYGITLSELEKNNKKLWHAIVGAGYLQHELHIDDEEVLTAVRYHTTGRAQMSLGERILFVADFISADRDYDGVETVRKKAAVSLEDAMLEGLSFTITELVENGRCVHPDTLYAYNDLIMHYREKGLI